MASHSQKRQIAFFLAAVLLPCSVLVALSLRMITQERELAEKRLADEKRRIADDVRQQLLARLERIKLEETSTLAAGGERLRGAWPDNSPVAFVARFKEGRPVLPWESVASGARRRRLLGQAPFAAKVHQGEQQEFTERDYLKAAARYDEALQTARHPLQAAYARLLLARSLAKSGQKPRAQALYRGILGLAWNLTDEQGIPLSLYAASGLLDTGAEHRPVQERVQGATGGLGRYSPAVTYLLRDILQRLTESAPAPIAAKARDELQTLAAHLRDIEQSLALERDFPNLGLGRASAGSAGNSEPLWVPYEQEDLWLVSVAPAAGTLPAIVIAVRAEQVFKSVRAAGTLSSISAGQAQLLSSPSAKGEALGANLPGLRILFPQQDVSALAKQSNPQRAFYLVTLFLVLSITLFAAYLLWRDVRREVRLAEMRSQFVSSVSHELKTPLTAIRMFAETLGMGRANDAQTQSEYLETIVNETQRLTRLLNNVLDFSKIEQGKRTYRLEPTCLAEVVQAAARTLQYPLAQQGFQLRVEIENGLPATRVDADAIEQAVLNLLTNAMKYSGESREIDLQLHRQGGQAVIEVRDKGMGIPRKEQPRIFEKFYRAPTPENLRVPGTGLGLTLVEHIAKAHGGYVEVQSEPGKGSAFSIHLPLEGAA
jgi:signal transduction histidine kinase